MIPCKVCGIEVDCYEWLTEDDFYMEWRHEASVPEGVKWHPAEPDWDAD